MMGVVLLAMLQCKIDGPTKTWLRVARRDMTWMCNEWALLTLALGLRRFPKN